MIGSGGGRGQVLLGFGAFGVFWGTWGAALPAIQARAHVGDATFGLSLLLIGAGALTTMRLTGQALDRFGPALVPAVIVLFAGCGVAAGSAVSAWTLALGMYALGALSGAFDVVINTAAVRYESASGRPLMGAAHGMFSAAVVVASALTGLARSGSAPTPAIFLAVAVLLLVAAAVSRAAPGEPAKVAKGPRPRLPVQLLVFGGMCALANLVENAQQSWSARQLEVTLGAPPNISGLGPSVFALATVTARLASHALAGRRISARATVVTGALLATAGTTVTAVAQGPAVCLAGVALAGLGTGVCAPTIISAAGAWVPAAQRGAGVSSVMTIAYLGFALGPAVVGLIAGAGGLRLGLGAVAALAAVLAVSALAMPKAPDREPEPARV